MIVAAGIDEAAGSLDGLLELAAADEAAGLPDAPWPPHYEKQEGEEPRVQPSKRRSAGPGPGVRTRPTGPAWSRPRRARPAAPAGGGARRCR